MLVLAVNRTDPPCIVITIDTVMGLRLLIRRSPQFRFHSLALTFALQYFQRSQAPSIFQNFQGTLDTAGTALGAVNVPNVPLLTGFTFSIAWVTVDAAAPFGIEAISGPWQVGITK